MEVKRAGEDGSKHVTAVQRLGREAECSRQVSRKKCGLKSGSAQRAGEWAGVLGEGKEQDGTRGQGIARQRPRAGKLCSTLLQCSFKQRSGLIWLLLLQYYSGCPVGTWFGARNVK